MSPPVSMLSSLQSFNKAGLHWIDNTPEELEATTKEMIQRTDGELSSNIPDDDLQQSFKAQAETYSLKYGGSPLKAFTPISRDFLERHADLLGDFH